MKITRGLGLKLAGVALLLLPFFCNPYAPIQELQLQAPKLIGAFALGNLALAFLLSSRIHWLMGFFHAAYTVSVLVTGFGSMQLYPFVYWSASAYFALWFVGLLQEEREFLWKFMGAGVLLAAVYAYIQIAGGDFIFHYAPGIDSSLPVSFFGQQTRYGSFAAPVAALLLVWPWGWVPSLLIAGTCVATGSSFVLASLLSGYLLVLGYRASRRLLAPLLAAGVILAIAGCVFLPNNELFFAHGRYEIWGATWRAWKQSPYQLFGFGPGSYGLLVETKTVVLPGGTVAIQPESFFSKNFQPEITRDHGNFFQAHNDYLQLIFECGWVGILIILVGAFVIGRALYRRWWVPGYTSLEARGCQAYLVAILVNALGNFPFQMSPHYFLAVLTLAIVLRDDRDAATIYPWPLTTSSP